ncbi:helix-turn-helix transcriptional regulator [Prauserella cavernicola]|uniref:YafY family transcriptional regulator n=1 Tax=Prauserella cavernicola TaxID=2800127 RepID=A0A934V446_9PSEU|nr:YafY family protein [Prauserella cavernicola]MBK1785037.1 YafY family transcriptional regulator [Prauserella cavernicola]
MRAERLVALLFTLQSRRSATVPELAEALGVSERTMHRDIATLQASGVPLWTEPGRYGGVRLVEGWRTRLDGLTSREAVAIFAMGVPRALAELGLGTAVSAAHAKVSATLPAPLREQAQHVAQRFHLDAPGWFREEDEAEHLADVARSVWEQRRTKITYRRGDGTVERVLDPLGLVLKAGVWYLVARADDSLRTYRVSRIAGSEPLEQTFERPPDFDLASWWQRSSAQFERSLRRQRVRVRLSEGGRRGLPRFVDADLAIAALEAAEPPDADGWTEVELDLEEGHIAAGQLLGLGAGVEVLEPPAVRAAFADAAQRMADRHR